MHVTGHGLTVAKARAHAYELARAVALPGMFYRTDIGETHEETMASLERLLPHPQPTGSSTA
jgi:phosphoribosylamine-glycine ligase